MGSIYSGLLFMHGHITNLDLVRRLAEDPKPTQRPTGKRQRTPGAAQAKRPAPRPTGTLAHGGCG